MFSCFCSTNPIPGVQFDFCPEYVEKKPNNEICIIYLVSQNREYKYLTVDS